VISVCRESLSGAIDMLGSMCRTDAGFSYDFA
jgi:hypothetical protein